MQSRVIGKVVALALVTLMGACSGQISNMGSGSYSGIMYPITANEADTVIATSMATVFPGRNQSRISPSIIGYAVTIDFALDKHRFSALAIPATGIDDQGKRVSGYTFEVAHDGTMVVQGPPRARSLFDRINTMAATIRAPLRTQ